MTKGAIYIAVMMTIAIGVIIAVNVIPDLGRGIQPSIKSESWQAEKEHLLSSPETTASFEGEPLALKITLSHRSHRVEDRIKELIEDNIKKIERFERHLAHAFKGKVTRSEKPREPNIFGIMMRTIHIAERQIVQSKLEGADVIIEPRVEHIGAGEFNRARECIRQGEMAAEEALRNNPVTRA